MSRSDGDQASNAADARYVSVRIDSAQWKAFVCGGAFACSLAIVPVAEVFDQATVRGLVFASGICALVVGAQLRRHFKTFVGLRVRRMIEPYD